MTLAIVFGSLFGFIFLVIMTWVILKCHYAYQRRQNIKMVQEAESKLKKALNKIEEQSSSFTRESQNLRQKLYNYEQNKKVREERELKKRQEEEAFT